MKTADYPALYRSASDLSKKAQDAFYFTFAAHMALLAAASAISVINSDAPVMWILQTCLLLSALGCAVYLYFARPDRHWYSARAVAESVKTITWRYMVKAEPFDHSDDIDQSNFGAKLKAIVDQNKDIAGRLITHLSAPQITSEMNRNRFGPLAERKAYYITHRISDQQSWYANKAATNKRKVNRYFLALVVTIALAIFFSIAKVRHPTAEYWPTDFLVTAAAGLLSWIQAKRFQELTASYALAAHEISLIHQQAGQEKDEAAWSEFVGDAENAFSREHTQWIARKDT